MMILALFALVFGILISINGAFTLSTIAKCSYILASVSLFLEMTMFAFPDKIANYWAYAALTHVFYQLFTIAPLMYMIYKGYKKSKSIADIVSLAFLAIVLGALFSCVGSLFFVAFVWKPHIDYWVANVVSVYDLAAPCCYIIVSVIQIHKLWPVGKFYPDIRRRIVIQGLIAFLETLVLIIFNILLRFDASETLTVFVAVDLLMLWDSTILAVIVRDIVELANNSIKEFKSVEVSSTRTPGGSSSESGYGTSVDRRSNERHSGNNSVAPLNV